MTSDRESVAIKAGADEDWWVKNNNKDTFVEIPSTINGLNLKTRWWTSYWFNQEPDDQGRRIKGYYVWGATGGPLPQFDSIFDPGKSVQQAPNGVWVMAIRNGVDAPFGAELVLEGMQPFNSGSHPGFGNYAVTAVATDFGSLDKNVCLGIFTFQYGNGPGPNPHREIDLLETIAGYQQTDDLNNAQFTLQPAYANPKEGLVNGLRFTIPKGTSKITTFMRWGPTPSNASPSASLRIYKDEPAMDVMISDVSGKQAFAHWEALVGPAVPTHLNERMHINFYVPNGRKGKGLPQTDQKVLITHFQYKAG